MQPAQLPDSDAKPDADTCADCHCVLGTNSDCFTDASTVTVTNFAIYNPDTITHTDTVTHTAKLY